MYADKQKERPRELSMTVYPRLATLPVIVSYMVLLYHLFKWVA